MTAVAAIEKPGGKVEHDDLQMDKPVTVVMLTHLRVTDGGLKELKGLKQLHTLDLVGTNVTDAGIKDLQEFKNLRSLDLRFTAVTGAVEGTQKLADAGPERQP